MPPPNHVPFQFLFKIDENLLRSILPRRMHVYYSVLTQSCEKSSLEHPSSPKACFLFKSDSKLMKTLSEASLLSSSMFLVQFLFKIDENLLRSIIPHRMHVSYSVVIRSCGKSSLKHSSCSKACFSFDSYWKLILIASPWLRDKGRSIGANYHSFRVVLTHYELVWKRQRSQNDNDSHPHTYMYVSYSSLIQNL